METNVALGGSTFKLTPTNFFYCGGRRVLVSDEKPRGRIREGIGGDRLSELGEIFKELGGTLR